MVKADILILAGQSNAVGVGHTKYLSEHFGEGKFLQYKNGFEKVQINYFSHNFKSNGFVPVTLGCSQKDRDTFGPEVGIAEYFSEKNPDKELYIVKCAFGGMSLYRDFLSPSGGKEYTSDAYADQYDDIISACSEGKPIRAGWSYNELIKLTGESIALLKDMGKTPVIRAFCWMQGESDSDSPEHVLQYSRRYGAFLSDFESEFKPYLENCIYVDGGISETWQYRREMNDAKAEYARTHKNCVYVDTIASGLTTENEPKEAPDIWHYDSDSVIKLGYLFAGKAGL